MKLFIAAAALTAGLTTAYASDSVTYLVAPTPKSSKEVCTLNGKTAAGKYTILNNLWNAEEKDTVSLCTAVTDTAKDTVSWYARFEGKGSSTPKIYSGAFAEVVPQQPVAFDNIKSIPTMLTYSFNHSDNIKAIVEYTLLITSSTTRAFSLNVWLTARGMSPKFMPNTIADQVVVQGVKYKRYNGGDGGGGEHFTYVMDSPSLTFNVDLMEFYNALPQERIAQNKYLLNKVMAGIFVSEGTFASFTATNYYVNITPA